MCRILDVACTYCNPKHAWLLNFASHTLIYSFLLKSQFLRNLLKLLFQWEKLWSNPNASDSINLYHFTCAGDVFVCSDVQQGLSSCPSSSIFFNYIVSSEESYYLHSIKADACQIRCVIWQASWETSIHFLAL